MRLVRLIFQYTCDRRLDYALHVTPTAWIDTEHLVNAQRDIRQKSILESVQLATEGVEGRMTWSKCVIEALEDVTSTKLESLGLGRWF